ncbi:autotransporter domain-containing protein [Bradyrhizobium sp. CB2312]|uniref:autotransporter outer membrane beta-barrel domain-containing protein n=1 Tax=Bradyrhizobium sp. CB2312 TaxID=3039155 RepID=UPI0024B1C2D1|nr:autotransporter domain-containing protein [Bradyrhizobium sp. CB2312]WFU69545.1 autotransporter domain-containing protein [Bradyrhizobium sp. CB2312]
MSGKRKDRLAATRHLRAALLTSSALALAWALPVGPARAASDGTWLASPGSNDYGTGSNWDGVFVPVGTASFGTSDTTSLVISSASVGGWTFNAGASSYTFDVGTLNFTGAGITVNGGSVTINYNFAMSSSFTGSSTAGDATLNINYLADLVFSGNSTAGNAAINNNGQIEFATTGPVTAGSISGSGYFDLAGNQLTVGSNNLSTAVTGDILNGSLVKIGSGTLTLLGAKTYAGGTTINGGTLQLGSAAGGGAILGPVTVGVSGTFSVFNGDTSGITSITNSGTTIFHNGSGASSANISNSGGLSFYDDSTAGSATITNTAAGTVNFYDRSTGGSATIANIGTLTFNGSSTAGNAAITNSGSFAMTIFGESSTAGSATITNNMLLSFVDNSTAGSATLVNNYNMYFGGSSTAGSASITNTGTITFNQSSTAGSSTITNHAIIHFLDNSTAGTATIVSDGTLSFNANSTAGNATIANNHLLIFDDNSTAGSANISNRDRVEFHGSSSAGNAALTNGQYLRFFDGSTAGAATITTVGSGTLEFRDTSTAGNATIVSTGSATLTFFNTSSAGSATITNEYFGLFRDNSTAGSATISNVGSGTMNFLDASSAGGATITNANALYFRDSSTAASANITNNGGIAFYGSATGGNATITNNGSITFFANSTAGNAVIISNASSLVDFSPAAGPNGDNKISAGSIAGAGLYLLGANELTVGSNNLSTEVSGDINGAGGSLVKIGSGTLTLSGTNAYTGGTTINAGTLKIAGAGTLGASSAGTTVAGGTLDLGGTAQTQDGGVTVTGGRITNGTLSSSGLFDVRAGIIDANLAGNGALTKGGSGTLTLSGANTYTGATIVNDGTLAVNGSIASSSSVTVNSGGTLSGTGIVGNTTIASGGTLSPGNSIGTLTVSGSLAFGAGSFYRVEVSTTAADRTNVSGTATLTGATVQAVALPGSFRSQTYTILNATGGFGGTKFAGLSVSGSFSPTRNPHLTDDPNNVYLVLDPSAIVLPAGTGANQSNVAGAINGAVASGGTPPAGFDALLNMGQPQLNHGLSQVSGQPGAAGTQAAFNATQQFVGMLDPLGGGGTDGERGATAGDGGAMGYASTGNADARVREAYAAVTPRDASGDVVDRRWGVWASAYGGASTLNGNTAAGSSTTTSHIYGTVVGADYRVSPNTLLGFALGGAGYNFALSDSLGSGRADLFQAGFYARHNFGPAYLSAALAYGWQDVTTDRTVTVSGTDKLTANFKASTFAGRLEAGWRFAPIPASSFGVTPYAAVQATTFHVPGYGETAIVGSNQFALSYTAQDTTNVRTELGARTDQRFLVNDGVLTLRGRLAWAHDTNTSRLVNAAFQTLPGAAFTVNGAQPAADSALVGGRAEMKWRNGLSLAGTVEGEFSQSTQTYTGKGTVRYEW